MKILIVNKFLFPKGGDAICAISTGKLLASKGHDVSFWGMEHPNNPVYPYSKDFVSHIDYGDTFGAGAKIQSAINILYSFEARTKIEHVILNMNPDIVHLHNFAHQISPSILHTLKKHSIPAVMTMHDYKMVCPAYTMLSKGAPCDRCKRGSFFWCVLNKCTKGSLVKSLINTIEMYLHHNVMNIYDYIHTYIAPSEFMAQITKEMGLKGHTRVLHNFVELDDLQPDKHLIKNECIYVGRLSQEKGLQDLLSAIQGLNINLNIVGDGPLRKELEQKISEEGIKNVQLLGYKTGKELKSLVKQSKFLIIPSTWYENNPLTIIEAFAMGKPVIGARIGGIPELVIDDKTGVTFTPFDAADLREKIEYMSNSDRLDEMGRNARKFAEENFGRKQHYLQLMDIYKQALEAQ